MPGATPESRVAEAREVIAHWRARTGTLVLSWPQRENDTDVDGTPLLPAGCAALVTGAAVTNARALVLRRAPARSGAGGAAAAARCRTG